jgi:hypothetical protein
MNITAPLDALTNAQTQFDSAARSIAKGPPSPEDMVRLLAAREQFTVGTRLAQTADQMEKRILDVLG